MHADHITGSGEIKKRIPECRSVIAKVSKAVADIKVNAGDKIKFGKFELEVRPTPGHTDGKYKTAALECHKTLGYILYCYILKCCLF